MLQSAAVQGFHREAVPRLLDAGLLQFFGLQVDGKTVGAYTGFFTGTGPSAQPVTDGL